MVLKIPRRMLTSLLFMRALPKSCLSENIIRSGWSRSRNPIV